jgi:hypothetical protein
VNLCHGGAKKIESKISGRIQKAKNNNMQLISTKD